MLKTNFKMIKNKILRRKDADFDANSSLDSDEINKEKDNDDKNKEG